MIKMGMYKHNQLTQMLLEKGYNAKRYPDYVKIPGYFETSADPLDNFYGGFEYQRNYIWAQPFLTGCGLYVKGESCLNDLGYMGIEWCYENNNPVVLCPFYQYHCEKNHELLRCAPGEERSLCFCMCQRTNDYVYENSIEFIWDKQDKEKRRLYAEFESKHNGRICQEHMYYKAKEKAWYFQYDPLQCARSCINSFCPVRNAPISSKKGNVFYDLQIKTRRKDGTFFDGEPLISIVKGKRFLDRSASIDICKEIAKTAAKQIWKKEWWNGYSTEHMYDSDLEIVIQNVRVESKESRDLMQDLEDIRNGITVVHESDRVRAAIENKKERRLNRKRLRLEALEKKLKQTGFDALDISDQRTAEKLFTEEQLAAFEQEYQNAPTQMSLFELIS